MKGNTISPAYCFIFLTFYHKLCSLLWNTFTSVIEYWILNYYIDSFLFGNRERKNNSELPTSFVNKILLLDLFFFFYHIKSFDSIVMNEHCRAELSLFPLGISAWNMKKKKKYRNSFSPSSLNNHWIHVHSPLMLYE